MGSKEIIEMRQKLCMTQQQFSTFLGVSISTLNNWENDRSKPSQMALEKLRKFKQDMENARY